MTTTTSTMLSTSQKIIITIALIVLIVGIALLVAYRPTEEETPTGVLPGEEQNPDTVTIEGGTRGALPAGNITVPEPIEQDGKVVTQRGDEAVPISVIGTPETDNKFRHFEIKAGGNAYSPSKITVREGDIVDIKLIAIDADYNFFLSDFGIYKTVPEGESRSIQFQAYPYGTYTFECKDVCSGDVTGTLVVARE